MWLGFLRSHLQQQAGEVDWLDVPHLELFPGRGWSRLVNLSIVTLAGSQTSVRRDDCRCLGPDCREAYRCIRSSRGVWMVVELADKHHSHITRIATIQL
ncbi:hypothetical protein DICSQDRAFT_130665, partial [Dichomitus squalens LYAD-421 SS1]|uniref:uncharacterized protein n=1 Tax=Dichomitus squalens (strain LYAD-421) TaxID=732165 RepID=UPI0004414FE1